MGKRTVRYQLLRGVEVSTGFLLDLLVCPSNTGYNDSALLVFALSLLDSIGDVLGDLPRNRSRDPPFPAAVFVLLQSGIPLV